MKRVLLFTVIMILMLLLTAPPTLTAPGRIGVTVDGEEISLRCRPLLVEGSVLVPLQELAGPLDFEINWNGKTGAVLITKAERTVEFTINGKTALRDGEVAILDLPPVVIQGNTIMVPVRFLGEALGAVVEWDEDERMVHIEGQVLPLVGSMANLKGLLADWKGVDYYDGVMRRSPAADLAVQEEAVKKAAPGERAPAYSSTNVQVQGVDEADLVKTDGEYIYQVNGSRVLVIKAKPAAEIQVVDVICFTKEDLVPLEVYVDDAHLVIIGSKRQQVYLSEQPLRGAEGVVPEIYPPRAPVVNTVKTLIYDIADKDNISKLREVELEGNYLSSRKIGSHLYLVANRYLDYHRTMEGEGELAPPAYRDTAIKNDFISVDYAKIRYFPDFVLPNYLLVGCLDLDRPEREMKVTTLLGAGANIYASPENLYVTVSRTGAGGLRPLPAGPSAVPGVSSVIHRFALEGGRVRYSGRGEVPGTVLNQFSLDEYDGYFRLATTTGSLRRTDEQRSKNNIYILDPELEIAGKIEGLAPGERIYSVRFLGELAYMVTFREVDPLFVLDLRDPRAPRVLGQLKIPGYSDYLHPYDDNHIIGFGKDTGETEGMKLAVFDVSNGKQPVEKFKEVIGHRGTDSELLRNHKALLFDRDKNLLAFPVTVMEVGGKTVNRSGDFSFQGAYVYGLDLEEGFTLRGRITHLTGDDYLRAGSRWYGSDRNIERILFIGDDLYTLSRGMIKVHDLGTMVEGNSLLLPW